MRARQSLDPEQKAPLPGSSAQPLRPLRSSVMSAYVVVDINVQDPTRYEEYKRQAAPSVSAFGGRYLVRGGAVTKLEGDWKTGRFVILEFPSAARAKEWWNSDLYRPIKAIRQATALTKMILVEGVG